MKGLPLSAECNLGRLEILAMLLGSDLNRLCSSLENHVFNDSQAKMILPQRGMLQPFCAMWVYVWFIRHISQLCYTTYAMSSGSCLLMKIYATTAHSSHTL